MAEENTEVEEKTEVSTEENKPNASLDNGDAEESGAESHGNLQPKAEAEQKESEDEADETEDKTEDEKDKSEEQSDKDKEASDETALDTDTWGSTGDEVGDSVLEVLQNSEITPEEAKALLYDAVKAGDPSKIDRDALVEKVGKAKANLVMAGIQNFTDRNAEKIKATMDVVHTAAGGKDNWEVIAPWAKANMDQDALKEYSDLIDAGGAKAKFAAQELTAAYNKDESNTSITGDTVEGETQVNADSGEAIGSREYAERLEVAHRNKDSAEIAKIQRARQRGRKKGIR